MGAITSREQKAVEIAEKFRIVQQGQSWIVPSQTTRQKYTVRILGDRADCTCPDFELRRAFCKHVLAVQIVIKREQNPDGTTTETKALFITERKTYPQKWAEYNRAQTSEKYYFQGLLHGLCEGIATPEQTGKGQRRLPLADIVFAATFKVYSTISGRRFMTDLRESKEHGFIGQVPHYNSIFNYLENPELRPILTNLIEVSALPLASVEKDFAVDSSGFSTSRFERWFDHKYNRDTFKREWVKIHLMTGVKTNIVTAVEIAEKHTHDGRMLPPLVETTAKGFQLSEVSGDKAYLSSRNIAVIRDAGATPFIPFKTNSSDNNRLDKRMNKTQSWRDMYYYFMWKHEDFLQRYHKRSNVETTFSMIKRKFGDSLRSKTDVAMVNEALCKILCHNLVVLIHEMFELGIDPVFLPNGLNPAQREVTD